MSEPAIAVRRSFLCPSANRSSWSLSPTFFPNVEGLNSSTFGINFYDELEARRYGAYIKKSDIADEQEEEIGTYIMMNF